MDQVEHMETSGVKNGNDKSDRSRNNGAMKVVFPDQLKVIRKAHHLSQEALGDMVGVTKSTISKWEGGSAEPSLTHLAALKSSLKAGLDQLIVGAVNPVALRQHAGLLEGKAMPYLLKEYEAELRIETMLELFQSLQPSQQQAAIAMLTAMKPTPAIAPSAPQKTEPKKGTKVAR